MKRKLLLTFCLLTIASATHAGITKWVDADGKVHYSDAPPPEKAKTQSLNIKNNPAPAAKQNASGAKSPAEQEMEFRKRRVEKEEAAAKEAKEQADSKEKQRNCTMAKNSLRTLQEGGRVSGHDEKGERIILDDSQRQKAIVDQQKAVDTWCK